MLHRSLAVAALLLGTGSVLHANVKLPAIFGDHMVLQEGVKLPVWGTADPGEAVTVTVGTEKGQATADATGQWKVELAPLAEGAPVTVTVAGKNNVTFTDVLVGDVWICSGQSNMEFDLAGDLTGFHGFGGASNADTAVPAANDPQLRLFLVAKKTALDPLTDVVGKWELCTPQTAGVFSAVGYFFGQELRSTLHRPIGLIGTYWGGTPAQAWTSLSGLQKDPLLQHYVEAHAQLVKNFPQATQAFPAEHAAFVNDQAAWKAQYGAAFSAAQQAWGAAVKTAVAAHQPPPPRPKPPVPMPHQPITPDGGPDAPANLFNGMIAPLVPFAIKGAIWYQGEANAGAPTEYRTLFPRMITDWREKWNQGDFPFLFVQLASWNAGNAPSWPFLREAQAMTLSLPKTGMATAIDIGDPLDIHPKDKVDVGHRLALAARHVAYGEKLVYAGPAYDAMQVQGDSVDISFTHVGGGLIIGSAPWLSVHSLPLPTDKLVGFVIAGADKKWVDADAKIQGDAVVVSSPQVPVPVAVRYDWANVAQGNLYNKETLPATPFRTDDWPDPAAKN